MKKYFNTSISQLKWVGLSLALMAVACGKKRAAFPISEQKLQQVLCDIQLAEAAWDSESQTMKDSISKLYYPQIFEHNGITSKDFDSSMHLLSDDPYLMLDTYKEVIKLIEKHQPKAESSTTPATDSSNRQH